MTVTTEQELNDLETDLVAAALLAPNLTELDLPETDFASPTLGAIWQAITRLHRDGKTPTPPTVAQAAEVRYGQVMELIGREIHPDALADGEGYRDAIQACAARRRAIAALTEAKLAIDGNTKTLDQITSQLTRHLTQPTDEDQITATLTLDEFVDQPLPDQEWVIPGLLARGDRAIITGPEGFGKTQFIRQIAICAAAGMNPFTLQQQTPKRVLYIDAENPMRIMINTMKKIRDALTRQGFTTDERLWLHRYPQGLDLGKETDRLALHHLCRTFQPDLVAIGPAYKLYTGGDQAREEDLARIVTGALDDLRETFDVAIILEHHSPHAAPGQKRTTRPIGSSLWMRWPEFGIGLKPTSIQPGHRAATLEHWRGMREERDWPEQIEQDTQLPWRPSAPDSWPRSA